MSTNYKTRSDASSPLSLETLKTVGDVRITLTAELGRRFISVEELLRFQVNDVFTLLRPTGEHVDFLAEDIPIGTAEIVATDENLSVHIVDLLDRNRASQETVQPKKVSALDSEDDLLDD